MANHKATGLLSRSIANFNYHSHLDLLSLLQNHPNQLFNILKNTIAGTAFPSLTTLEKIKVLVLSGFIHRVMIKDVEHWLKEMVGDRSFWTFVSNSSTCLLQILNVVALSEGLNYKILNISCPPPCIERGSYQDALWSNALMVFSHGEWCWQTKKMQQSIAKGSVLQARTFLNDLIDFKQEIIQVAYSQQTELSASLKPHYHELDLQLAQQKIITVNYLPDDYDQEYIEIWLDRTVELNSLLGNFVCKEKFGEFEYIRGPLTYTMQQGITIVFNNFNQISNELLVSLVSLAREGQMTHNQKTIKAAAGFKIIGILSGEKDNKSKANINKLIKHIRLPAKTMDNFLPAIENESNRDTLRNIFTEHFQQLGYFNALKLWKRVERLRREVINTNSETFSEGEIVSRLWNSFFTQQFIDDIQLQINDLRNRTDPHRQIIYQSKYKQITIGRTQIKCNQLPTMNLVKTQYSLAILEKLNICFELGEYPLLVSETGCGKTTLVQYLAQLGGHKLYVYNMSSGTDVTDLIGGFKPVDCRLLLKDLFYSFIQKFREEVPGASKNQAYLSSLSNYYIQGKLQVLLKSVVQSIPRIIQQLPEKGESAVYEWKEMSKKFTSILHNIDKIDSNLVFSFLEGNLIKAIKNGDWILIDEINLATNDVLQKIIPLIEDKSLLLYEKGDLNYVQRHPQFRIVACMNPANDSGKKPLPPNLAEKFTSIVMSDPSRADVEMMAKQMCPQLNEGQISQLYFQIKKMKTVSLRNLSRALAYINRNKDTYGWNRSVYDGLMLGFGDKELLKKYYNETVPKIGPGMVEISGFLLQKGQQQEDTGEIFHLTDTFKAHLKDLLRAIAGTELPVLLEGPTSAGKTSMIRHLAQTVGYKCIRINNHEHTEIEEYIGNYFPDKTGKLVFREGPLVTAVREGYWLILDELNLAKTEILECLNRLLDDNRELFIPEQQKHIKPHPNFRIFATQNPSSYSGRKTLSRAFRNRFVSISFADINTEDTMAILEARSPLLKDSKELSSFVKKTLQSLMNYRQRQRVFEKEGLITIRNLLKWCERPFVSKEKFIIEGYAILAEKLRSEQEKKFVQKALLSSAKLTLADVQTDYFALVQTQFSQQKIASTSIYVQMNNSFKRMAALTLKAINNKEPVLLVGQTGCGKTTLAELIAALSQRPFFSINCHKHMQASDLLGSLRPSVNPTQDLKFQFINGVVIEAMLQGGILLIDEINTAEDSVLERLNQVLQCGVVGIERGEGWETVVARPGFCIIGTMNPSGDYGKKELSPALRNRFTEIWVQPITHPEYIVSAGADIMKMISHKLTLHPCPEELPSLIYSFLVHYNCEVAPRYNLTRKLMTMRDIGWICKFMNDCDLSTWQQKYFWSITILAVEGIKYMMTDNIEGRKLENMKQELLEYLNHQISVQEEWMQHTRAEDIVAMLQHMNFPLLIKTDVPVQVLGIHPHSELFFSPQTDLSDLLGQYRPHGNDFVWHDQPLLKRVKEGGTVTLIDLNMAQQQVVEGVNSLFDHRGSLFVVELNQTFYKAPTFKGVVVLREEGGNGRKGLPNSFLNRFVKLYIPEVSHQKQVAFLSKKYPSIVEDASMKELIVQLLREKKEMTIEHFQFLIQLRQTGLLNQGLQILNMSNYLNKQYDSAFSEIQYRLLELLPLKKSFGIFSPTLISIVIQSYIVYKYSTFSLCLVGQSEARGSVVKALGYLLNKNVVPILISTMLDINDLLGTYEQLSVEEEMLAEKGLVERVFECQKREEYKSEQTKFVFVESRVVKSLQDAQSMVYVQAPNESIAERIEKGITDVYNQQKKMVIGLDSLNQQKSSINKFIILDLTNLNEQQFSAEGRDQTYLSFPSNETNLTHYDASIRRSETQSFISEVMNDQNDRNSVSAWRRVLDKAVNNSSSLAVSSREELRERIVRQAVQRYGVEYVQDSEQESRLKIVLSAVKLSPSKEILLSKISLFCFFTSDPEELSKKLIFLGQNQQQLSDTISKFQVLYLCNVNNFKQSAQTILPMVLSSRELAQKYFREVERMYEELFRFKVQQILVQFSEEEYKLVPIVSNPETVKYLLKSEPADIRILCNEGVHLDHVLEGVEQVVIRNVILMQVDIPTISHWSKNIKVKTLGALSLLQQHLQKRMHIFQNPLQDPWAVNFLKQLNLFDSFSGKSLKEKGELLWQMFKPSGNMSVNLSYHLQNELNRKFYSELIAADNLYLSKYHKLAKTKYCGYLPKEIENIGADLEGYRCELANVEKMLVYRGHDNIENLIDFYTQLIKLSASIEESHFDPNIIQQVITQTYANHYHIYNDVLMPYYLALLTLHYSAYQDAPERTPSLAHLLQKGKADPIQLIEKMIEKEEGEVDRSKDYLRFQRKFNKTVIVNEYTQEGVAKNKQNIEQQFQELFGKRSDSKSKVEGSPFEEIHMLINKSRQSYYKYLSQSLFTGCQSYEQLVIGLQVLLKVEQTKINIYQEYNPEMVKQLVSPLATILQQIHRLIAEHPIDNIKNLANLCNKIQERSIYDEVYKILTDCEYLIERIFEVNPILPMAKHIQTKELIDNCLKIRKLQLKNWKEMMDLKVRRTEKNDMIEFLALFKNIKLIQNEKELFSLCEQYLRESKISCIRNRIQLLLFLQQEQLIPRAQGYQNALFRVLGFYSYLMPEVKNFVLSARRQKEKEMREYQKLAGWNSHEFLIFKATCEKFQRKIHHILRRHDEELSVTVGSYHQQILAAQFYPSIKQFKVGLSNLLQNKELQIHLESEEEAKSNDQRYMMEEEPIEPVNQLNNYEQISSRIFASLSQLQQEHHNTQSKLLIIRRHLSDLEDTFSQFVLSANVEYRFIARQMFPSDQQFQRGSKYYYGLWDKLCQRAEAKAYRDIIDRLWHVTEKIWVHINLALKYVPPKTKNHLAQDLQIITENFINKDSNSYHPLFQQQLSSIKVYLAEVEEKQNKALTNSELWLQEQTVSLMKLGYILANIAVNLQKNGLCAKEEEEEENEESGSEEVGDGMGIGEGQAHSAAENVGDEIQFEEQVMGHKDEQKNDQDNADKKDEKDIEMENDFQGQMYSKEEEQEGENDEEGKQKEADEKMGSVDEKEKEKDMKNEAGEAEGDGQADVDIRDQKEGEQELIDNQREKKEERKGQDQRDMDEEEEGSQEDKSQWDDNNEQGEKINKQKEQVEARDEEDSSINMDQKQPEEIEESGSVKSGEEEEKEGDGDNSEMEEENQESEKSSEMANEDGEKQEEGSDLEMEPEDLDEEEKPRERKGKQSKQYNPAYGRRDINTNNEVLNEEEQPAEEEGQQGNQEQGGQEGNQGSGNPIHNLSSQFLEEVLKQQRAEGNQKFIKDLNVLINDNKEQLPEDEEENAQQFQMTQQKDKFATNLPLLDDHKMKNEEDEEKDEKKQEQRNPDNVNQEKKQGEKKEKSKKEKQEKQKAGKEPNKNSENREIAQAADTAIKIEQIKKDNKAKEEENRQKIVIDVDEDKQQLIRKVIFDLKVQPQQETSYQNIHANEILSEAFDVSKILEEQLKSVLEPMDNAEYRGDFKTGKKLNLKKIIPFIASNYRKDRIWLRRTEPSERNYYVMIALDDTKSMHYGDVGSEALKGMLAISMAMEHLSIKTSICSIRDQMVMLKRFGDLLNSQAILNSFQFEYQSSNSHDLSMAAFMNSSLQTFKKVEEEDINIEVKKLCFIISDGKMNKKLVTPFMKDAKKEDITYIFIVVDSQQSSILSIKSVEYVDKKMKIKSYMSDFPFQYFLIVNDVKELGEILAMTLLQFIQEK